jgi:isoleucyl-tRNA synthetase
MRKDAGFEVIDRINIKYKGSEKIVDAVKAFSKYISNETLAEKLDNVLKLNGGFKQDWKIGEYDCSVQIEKVKS